MKKISINQIKNGDLLGKPQKIVVKISFEGEECEFDTHILPFSYKTAVAHMQAFGEKKEALAGVLASTICDDKGEFQFSEEDIRDKFSQELVEAIWNKVVEINVMGKKLKSQQMTNSSSKSESPSGKATRKSKNSHTPKLKDTLPTSKNTEAST